MTSQVFLLFCKDFLFFSQGLFQIGYLVLLLVDLCFLSGQLLFFQLSLERVLLENSSFLRDVLDGLLGLLGVLFPLGINFSCSCNNLFLLLGEVFVSFTFFSFLLE